MHLPPVEPWVVLSFCSLIFLVGLYGLLLRRNGLIILMSIELMLNAVNLTYVTFSRQLADMTGQMSVFFIITGAAAESAVCQRAKARELEASLLDNLRKNGMQVTQLPAAEMQLLRERMKPVIARHGEKVSGTAAELQAELDRLRK